MPSYSASSAACEDGRQVTKTPSRNVFQFLDMRVLLDHLCGGDSSRQGAGPNIFRFLDLPRELRDHTYSFVAGNNRNQDDKLLRPHMRSKSHCQALAQVSQQIRAEFLPIFHARCGLALYHRHMMNSKREKALEDWLEIFGKSRLPLFRSFRFWITPTFTIELTLHNGGGNSHKERMSVAISHTVTQYFERDFRLEVDTILKEDDGTVYLDQDGLRRVMRLLSLAKP